MYPHRNKLQSVIWWEILMQNNPLYDKMSNKFAFILHNLPEKKISDKYNTCTVRTHSQYRN